MGFGLFTVYFIFEPVEAVSVGQRTDYDDDDNDNDNYYKKKRSLCVCANW